MGDISHTFGSDIDLSASGDFLCIAGDALTQQSIIKRILTAPEAYLWHLDYGAGAGQMVGQTVNVLAVQNIIRAQIFQEDTVAQLPEPVVTVQAQGNGVVVCDIQYWDAQTGQSSVLTLTIGN